MPRGVSDVAYLDVANPTFSIGSPAVLAAREANWYARTPYGIAVLRYDAVRQLLEQSPARPRVAPVARTQRR